MGKVDKKQKVYFKDPRKFADLWNGVFYHGEQVISWEELTEVDSVQTHIEDGQCLERIGDVIMKRTAEGEELAILLVENQKEVDYSMPVRILMEEALAYEKQVKAIKRKNEEDFQHYSRKGRLGFYYYYFTRKDKLRPVCTLVLFWNEGGWDGAKSLHELIDFKGVEEMRSMVPEFPIHLIDMEQLRDEKVFHTDLRTLVALYRKRNSAAEFKSYCDNCEEEFRLVGDGALALSALVKSSELNEYCGKTMKGKEENVEVCKAITDLIAEGKREGREEEKRRVIMKMLRAGNAPKDIASLCGYPMKMVLEVQNGIVSR